MRNKVIFLLLFVFSFIIVHDTVLDVMQPDQEMIISQDSAGVESGKNCQTLHHLHNMFHFVALMDPDTPTINSVKRETSIVTALLQYLSLLQEQDDRPPIA